VGDLPIFIAHHSADCWSRPELYCLDDDDQPTVVAGVPPDDLGPLGQRWGNPLYRWDQHEARRLRLVECSACSGPWRRPTCSASTTSCGFSRLLRDPGQQPHRHGRPLGPGAGPGPVRRHCRANWVPLPIVAEDLGLITPDVIELRDGCGFPGMKILQFAFGGDGAHEFLPHNYGPPFVVYTGTHDNDTARGWWLAAKPHERAFAAAYLACGEHDVHWAMIRAASQLGGATWPCSRCRTCWGWTARTA
jgi:4-alpha-glucanotransferase